MMPTNSMAEGEQHYLARVVTDRFTGSVIDKQIEIVNEWPDQG